MLLGLPTILTLVRLVFSFLFTPFLLWSSCSLFSSQSSSFMRTTCAVLFFAVGLTDLFDGYLARRWNEQTTLGKILDPLADKVFVTGPLLVLMHYAYINPYIVFLLLVRDLIVTSLRQAAVDLHFDIPVSSWGKIKSCLLVLYITWALGSGCRSGYPLYIEYALLSITLFLSLFSGGLYVGQFVGKLE